MASELTIITSRITDPNPQNFFGYDVAVSGDTVLVGEINGDLTGPQTDEGLVYAFVFNGQTWDLQATLAATAPATGDFFGYAVELEGDTMVVGAPYDDEVNGSGQDEGAAYVCVRSGTT